MQSGKLGTDICPQTLYKKIKPLLQKTDGITFSGGEPLYQYREVAKFLDLLPENTDLMLFTGYTKDELSLEQLRCYNRFDLVIEGRFEISKKGNFLWRGSKNQKFFSPTHKYEKTIDNLYRSSSAGLQIDIKDQHVLYYGIPTNNNEIEAVEKILNTI